MRLSELEPGLRATVIALPMKPASRRERLAAYGIVIGSGLRLVARRPVLVIACGATMLAIDDEMGEEILVTEESKIQNRPPAAQ